MRTYTEAYDFLQQVKENEQTIELLMMLEKLGCKVPTKGPIDVKEVLEEAGRHDVIEMFEKNGIFNNDSKKA